MVRLPRELGDIISLYLPVLSVIGYQRSWFWHQRAKARYNVSLVTRERPELEHPEIDYLEFVLAKATTRTKKMTTIQEIARLELKGVLHSILTEMSKIAEQEKDTVYYIIKRYETMSHIELELNLIFRSKGLADALLKIRAYLLQATKGEIDIIFDALRLVLQNLIEISYTEYSDEEWLKFHQEPVQVLTNDLLLLISENPVDDLYIVQYQIFE